MNFGIVPGSFSLHFNCTGENLFLFFIFSYVVYLFDVGSLKFGLSFTDASLSILHEQTGFLLFIVVSVGKIVCFNFFFFLFSCRTAPPLKLVDLPGVDKGHLDDPLVSAKLNIMDSNYEIHFLIGV